MGSHNLPTSKNIDQENRVRMLACFGPILACGRSFFFFRQPNSSRPAPINVEEAAVVASQDGGAAPFPNGRWIDALADPNFRALEVMDAMQGSTQGTLWLHLAVKNLRIRAPFTQQYELFPLYWLKTGKPQPKLVEKCMDECQSNEDEAFSNLNLQVLDDESSAGSLNEDVVSNGLLCGVCMEAPANLFLLPCRHDNFCQMCMLRIVCHWNQSHGPGCPICRAPIATIVIVDDSLPADTNSTALADLLKSQSDPAASAIDTESPDVASGSEVAEVAVSSPRIVSL